MRKFGAFFLSVIGIVPVACLVLSSCAPAVKKDSIQVHVINVGYGDSILIKFPDHTNLLIDSGTKEAAQAVIDYLRSQGVETIDKMVATHQHRDHFGGFSTIIDAFPVEKFYYNGDEKGAHEGYTELLDKVKKRQIPMALLGRDQSIPFDNPDIRLKVLNPPDHSGSINNNALVLWLTYGRTGFLFTADVEEVRQDDILKLYPELKKVNCVQVPHHGKSVSPYFADFFRDKIFFVSAGFYRGKPISVEFLDRLRGTVLRTDIHGTIVIESDGNKVSVLKP